MTISEIIDRLVVKVVDAMLVQMANGKNFAEAKSLVSAELNVTGSAIWGIVEAKLC